MSDTTEERVTLNQIDEDMIGAVIRRARQLIERGWCQGVEAQMRQYDWWRPVSYMAAHATHFCLNGALRRAAR